MPRYVVLGGLVVALAADRAQAQIISVPNPITGGAFNYARFNATSVNVPAPFGTFSYNSVTFGGNRNQRMAAAAGYGAQAGYLSGGVGGVPAFAGLPAADPNAAKKQAALAQAQRQAARPAGAVEARAAIADQWAYEVGAKPAAANGPAKNVNPNLLDATPDEILSGVALNDLLLAVRPMADAGRAAESPLLPPDLLARVEFAGGPTADGVNQLRAGTLAFPAPLRDAQHDELRRTLAADFAALAAAVGGPRPGVVAAADKLAGSAKKGREAVAPALREMAYPDAVETVRFFHRLEAAARVQRDPATAPAYVPNWSALGLTVKELARHMAKYKLTFAPATAADGGAYDVLYHGMTAYYVGLARAGK
jgi:hypothetical protein